MSTLCKYAQYVKCKSCTCNLHKECKKFVVVHAHVLSRELEKFHYNSELTISTPVVWSKDKNKAKSAALKYALKVNSVVRKYTLSQVISLALSNEPVESRVVYIEYQTKLAGEPDKLKGVLSSFIDNITLRGGRVSVFVAPSIPFNLEYNKL